MYLPGESYMGAVRAHQKPADLVSIICGFHGLLKIRRTGVALHANFLYVQLGFRVTCNLAFVYWSFFLSQFRRHVCAVFLFVISVFRLFYLKLHLRRICSKLRLQPIVKKLFVFFLQHILVE